MPVPPVTYTSVAALALSSVSLVVAGWALGSADREAAGPPVASAVAPARWAVSEPRIPAGSPASEPKAPSERGVGSGAGAARGGVLAVPAAPDQAASEDARSEPTRAPASLAALRGEPGAPDVRRLVVVRRVEQREPVLGEPLVAGDEPVVAFVELANPGDAGEIVVTFQPAEGGAEVGHVRLTVPAQQGRWRTWARTRNVRDAGEWRAIVRSADGRELARTEFTVG